MDILGIIPARGGSKGIPYKNIKLLGNKPLITYTIEAALNSKHLTKIVVSTEDKHIARVANNNGVEVLDRPKELSEDQVPIFPDVLLHAVKQLPDIYTIIVILQPTSPFRTAKYIDLVIDTLINEDCDWAATVTEAKLHPFRMKQIIGGRLKPLVKDSDIWGQRQDFPLIYHLNGAVFATWSSTLINEQTFRESFENGSWTGIGMSEKDGWDIHTMLDFWTAEAILRENK